MSDLIPPQPEPTGAARVEMLNFSKRFGALQALDDVSLTIEAGSFHALLGENGAGKSTLVKSLIGFYRADTGSVMVEFVVRMDGRADTVKLSPAPECLRAALTAWVSSFRYLPPAADVPTGVEWMLVTARRGS